MEVQRHLLDVVGDIFRSDGVFGRVFAAFWGRHFQSLAEGVDAASGLSVVRMVVSTEKSTLSLGDHAAGDVHAWTWTWTWGDSGHWDKCGTQCGVVEGRNYSRVLVYHNREVSYDLRSR
jgi:hypothetical protein